MYTSENYDERWRQKKNNDVTKPSASQRAMSVKETVTLKLVRKVCSNYMAVLEKIWRSTLLFEPRERFSSQSAFQIHCRKKV